MRSSRVVRACAALAGVVLVAGCAAQASPLPHSSAADAGSTAEQPAADAQPAEQPAVTTRELSPEGLLTDFYVAGQMATLRVPSVTGPAPMVVVIPGGGWDRSDPTDYQPLAQALTAAGMTTSLITYSTTETGAQFPVPIDDVACAVRWSAFQLTALGYPPERVVVAGHSAGGQLGMEVALTGDRFGADCPYPPVTIDAAVGIAGVYDLGDPALVGPSLFPDGGTAEERAQFSPVSAATDPQNPLPSALSVLLLTGADDTVVPAAQAQELAAALRARGIEPTEQVFALPHEMGFPLATEISPLITAWIRGEPYVPSPSATPVPSAAPVPAESVPAAPVPSASPAPLPAESVPAPAAPSVPASSPTVG